MNRDIIQKRINDCLIYFQSGRKWPPQINKSYNRFRRGGTSLNPIYIPVTFINKKTKITVVVVLGYEDALAENPECMYLVL